MGLRPNYVQRSGGLPSNSGLGYADTYPPTPDRHEVSTPSQNPNAYHQGGHGYSSGYTPLSQPDAVGASLIPSTADYSLNTPSPIRVLAAATPPVRNSMEHSQSTNHSNTSLQDHQIPEKWKTPVGPLRPDLKQRLQMGDIVFVPDVDQVIKNNEVRTKYFIASEHGLLHSKITMMVIMGFEGPVGDCTLYRMTSQDISQWRSPQEHYVYVQYPTNTSRNTTIYDPVTVEDCLYLHRDTSHIELFKPKSLRPNKEWKVVGRLSPESTGYLTTVLLAYRNKSLMAGLKSRKLTNPHQSIIRAFVASTRTSGLSPIALDSVESAEFMTGLVEVLTGDKPGTVQHNLGMITLAKRMLLTDDNSRNALSAAEPITTAVQLVAKSHLVPPTADQGCELQEPPVSAESCVALSAGKESSSMVSGSKRKREDETGQNVTKIRKIIFEDSSMTDEELKTLDNRSRRLEAEKKAVDAKIRTESDKDYQKDEHSNMRGSSAKTVQSLDPSSIKLREAQEESKRLGTEIRVTQIVREHGWLGVGANWLEEADAEFLKDAGIEWE